MSTKARLLALRKGRKARTDVDTTEEMTSMKPKRSHLSCGPGIAFSWYKNPNFSDITIQYGPEGAHRFDGHRLVLSNSSELFQLSSNPGFHEADTRVVTLEGDHPKAMDALFEYCYVGV